MNHVKDTQMELMCTIAAATAMTFSTWKPGRVPLNPSSSTSPSIRGAGGLGPELSLPDPVMSSDVVPGSDGISSSPEATVTWNRERAPCTRYMIGIRKRQRERATVRFGVVRKRRCKCSIGAECKCKECK